MSLHDDREFDASVFLPGNSRILQKSSVANRLRFGHAVGDDTAIEGSSEDVGVPGEKSKSLVVSLMHGLTGTAGAPPKATDPGKSHCLMIDAGSGGSRLHVYEFKNRVFNIIPPPISDVTTDSRWTSRLKPGLATLYTASDEDLPRVVAEYLFPLLEFARTVLHEKKDHWSEYFIYLKGTGGMRTLSVRDRKRIINTVRDLFRNEFTPLLFEDTDDAVVWNNPFRFDQAEQARVISGEEEAIYGWTAINYLMGTLQTNSQGFGTVSYPNRTFGALDLGGASTQISFYEPDEDIVANLFKMQIGASRHWNVYAHSFLYFGVNLARERMGARLIMETDKESGPPLRSGTYFNPCLPGMYNSTFTSKIHFTGVGMETWDGASKVGKDAGSYSVLMYNDDTRGDFDKCLKLTTGLLRLDANGWCKFAHGGDCSFAGIYQPPLPRQAVDFGEFFAFANYLHIFKFNRLSEKSTLDDIRSAAEHVCGMSYEETVKWNKGRLSHQPDLQNYCFLTTYAYAMLTEGYGFKNHDNITAASVIDGQKVGWALGSTLYEINTMEWSFRADDVSTGFRLMSALFAVGMIVIVFIFAMKTVKAEKGRGFSIWNLKDAKSPNGRVGIRNDREEANYGSL